MLPFALPLLISCQDPSPTTPTPTPTPTPTLTPTPTPIPSTAPPAAAAKTPVLLLTLDTTRADRIGAWGHTLARTPNLDALAARGTRFARAFAPVPLTIPSHSTMFTGLLPPRHGVHTNGDARLSDDAVTLAERLQAAGWQTHAAVGAYVTQAHWGFGQGFDAYADELGLPSDRLNWRAERRADAVVDDALAALDDGAEFLWVHVFDAHSPYEPPEAYATGRPYDDEIAFVDAQVGRLLQALPADTLIVVSGDHGEAFGAGGEQEHGLLLTRETLHVPLLFAGPGVPAGEVVNVPVSLADITPTLLNLLGVPDDDFDFDGVNLFNDPKARDGIFSEALQGAYLFGWAPLRGITGQKGRLLQGGYETIEGTPPADAAAQIQQRAGETPSWEVGPLTLDPGQLEQLQALGYIAAPTEADPVLTGTLDPRDGIGVLKELRELKKRPPSEQEATLRDFIETFPKMRDARFRLGRLLAKQGRMNEAISQSEDAYRISPDSTTAIFIGSLWMQVGAPVEALQWYREALTHDPRSLNARAGEVEALLYANRLEEARATAELYLDQAPDHGRMMLIRAMLAIRNGEPTAEMVEPVTQLAWKRPFERGALQTASALQRLDGDAEEAVALLRAELRMRPSNLQARLELTALFREQGRLVDVVKTLRPLVTIQPNEPRWHAMTAEAYLAMNRPDRAAPHLEACAGHPQCPKPVPDASP
ncbi:MAG: sulfatase-like hydrolase/transferase [Myxococcota bacterium]